MGASGGLARADALRMIHLVTEALMVWPLYALVVVNQRADLGQSLGDRADTYLENIVNNRMSPCFVFQATVVRDRRAADRRVPAECWCRAG